MHSLARGPLRAGRAARTSTAEQTAWAMGEILAGEATPAQIAGLRGRAARQGRDDRGGRPAWSTRCTPPPTPLSVPGRLLDVVGTGGDRSMSVNISTMAAIVAAGAGRPGGQARQPLGVVAVRLRRRARGARHPARPAAGPGRRGGRARPASPSASPPAFHPAMRHAAVPRRELGVGTTFNFLGPLANPARPAAQAIGCADRADGAGDGRGLRRARRRRLGVPRRRRARRADHDDDVAGVGGARRRGRARRRVDPADVGLAARHRRGAARRRRGAQRRRRTPPARRRAGRRCATPCCSTPARRSRSTTRPASRVDERARAPGSAEAREAVDAGAARATLDRWVAPAPA